MKTNIPQVIIICTMITISFAVLIRLMAPEKVGYDNYLIIDLDGRSHYIRSNEELTFSAEECCVVNQEKENIMCDVKYLTLVSKK